MAFVSSCQGVNTAELALTAICLLLAAAVPSPNCLNVSRHCPNDVDYLCDKTDLNRHWCTCWGGVTECVTLGVCRFTPCKACQVCLGWAATQTPQLFNTTNAGLVAAEVNTRCKGWGRTSAACQSAADAVALSESGNSGKRGGLLCSLMNECVNPAGVRNCCWASSACQWLFSSVCSVHLTCCDAQEPPREADIAHTSLYCHAPCPACMHPPCLCSSHPPPCTILALCLCDINRF